jgi:hypothetical protein
MALSNDHELNVMPCVNGNRLLVSRDYIGNPRLTLHCDHDTGEYVLVRKSPYQEAAGATPHERVAAMVKGAEREVERYAFADPSCFRRIYCRIMELTNRDPFP